MSQKVPTFKLSVTLWNLNRFSKFLHCWKAYEILLQKPYDIIHLTLGMLLQYRAKLKIQIFCRHSAYMPDMEVYKQIAFSRLQLCYSSTNFDIIRVYNREFSPHWLQINFSMLLFFTCLLLRSICGTWNASQLTSLRCLSLYVYMYFNTNNAYTLLIYSRPILRYSSIALNVCKEFSWAKSPLCRINRELCL